jgi:tRNA threonylcarbamoyl adenosine modification protein YeaZ
MRILSMDTATEAVSCAIIDENKLLGEITFNFEKQHSIILMPIVDKLLTRTKLSLDSIDGFIISKGPGSFTGLRIGMATVKGLAFGVNKPIISVSTLDALAYNLSFTSGVICPIMDALRDNVYTGIYKSSQDGISIIEKPMVISIDDLINKLKDACEPIYFVGDGTHKYFDKLKNNLPNCFIAPVNLNLARASSLGELGMKLLKQGYKDDINTVAPIYIRKSQAEREYEKKFKVGVEDDGGYKDFTI